ncbi:MAG: HAD-IIA family hydrolase [Kiritimatiellae bacterium]|nr:HAD-IIA family hydrolase [Kiritimatiellia bacterium]
MKTLDSFQDWFEAHRDELDALVLDIDGVLALNHKPIPGARRLVAGLQRAAFPFSLLTNDGNHSKAQKCAFLRQCGVRVAEADIVSCADGLVELAETRQLKGRLFFVMGDLGRPSYARLAGLRVTRRIRDLPDCTGVVIGEQNYHWERVINAVVNTFIAKPDALLVVPNPDEYYGVGPSAIEIAAGGVARFVQRVLRTYGVRVHPLYLGKPYRPIFRHHHLELERKLNRRVPRSRVMILGDSLASDIRGANAFGYRSALILTGITQPCMLAASPVHPELVCRRL